MFLSLKSCVVCFKSSNDRKVQNKFSCCFAFYTTVKKLLGAEEKYTQRVI